MTRPDDQQTAMLPPMKWNAWGDPAAAKPLSDGIRALLKQALGVDGAITPDLEAQDVKLRPSALTDADSDALAEIVGADYCRVDDQGRLLRAGGKSTLDLLRRKDSGVQDAPDAVLLPSNDDEIAAILRYCSDARGSRSSRSAAERVWSADSTRSAAISVRWSPWICAA